MAMPLLAQTIKKDKNMKSKDRNMKNYYFEQEINVALDSIDMYKWLRELTDVEYQSFSKGHIAMGHLNTGELGGMVNTEKVGSNILIQHYKIIKKSDSFVDLYSSKTKVLIFHLIPAKLEVYWTVKVVALSEQKSKFICEVRVRYPSRVLKFLSASIGSPYFVQRHVEEEGALFAADIEKKFK